MRKTTMKRRLCLAQINYLDHDASRHEERLRQIIAENRTADLIVFPELILHGHPSKEKPEGFLYRKMERRREVHLSERMYRFVREMDARVIMGEIKRKGEMFYNLATYMDRDMVRSYVKTHVHWTENFIPGNELPVFSTPVGNIGMTICFDAAFVEVGRILALRGADIIVNISAVPKSFAVDYMWRRLAGMAINNQVFAIYVNRPGGYFAGHSAVFDPRGNLTAAAGNDEEILLTEIDLEEIDAWREKENIYGYRRPRLYREIEKTDSLKTAARRLTVAGRRYELQLQLTPPERRDHGRHPRQESVLPHSLAEASRQEDG